MTPEKKTPANINVKLLIQQEERATQARWRLQAKVSFIRPPPPSAPPLSSSIIFNHSITHSLSVSQSVRQSVPTLTKKCRQAEIYSQYDKNTTPHYTRKAET